MQEQNFEKQVQQKMEELSFTPSAPVWQKVEEQIRRKKHRRRIFFWMIPGFLLLAGGLWLVNKNNGALLTAKINEATISTPSDSSQVLKNKIEKKQIAPSIFNTNKQQPNKIQNQLKQIGLTNKQAYESKEISKKRKSDIINIPSKAAAVVIKQNAPGGRKGSETNPTSDQIILETEEQKNENKQKEVTVDSSISTAMVDSSISKAVVETNSIDETGKQNQTLDSLNNKEKDSAAIATAVATNKKTQRKWRSAIVAGIGRSGINNGLGLFGGGAKAFNADAGGLTSQPSNSGATYKPPSSQEKSLAFSIGLLAKKQISRRSSFSIGLRYNYYSTQMLVGQNMRRDTIAAQNFRVDQFYANSGSSYSNYHNQFHFISLPATFNFQLIKEAPLQFHLGLSLQQLVNTNALLYSSSSGIYYRDNDSFNKTYLFSQFGLGYLLPLGKTMSLQIGPELNYSHSRVIKGSSDQHLFSYGIGAQFIFSGK